MANKKSKKAAVKSQARPIDEKTGYREGSLGYSIGRAYLGESKHEAAVEAVEAVFKASAKSKGKPTDAEFVHRSALGWIRFLKARDSKRYKDLPRAEKKAERRETVAA